MAEEVGKGVTRLKKGDRVVVLFTIACGQCFFCSKTLFAACKTTHPPGARHPRCGRRRPFRLFASLRPPRLVDEQMLFLSDILPIGYQATGNGEVGPGSTGLAFYPRRSIPALLPKAARWKWKPL
ncbi:alcohol dehydrogenase catalytic domain-containing protein [Variovorax sp. RKNM96]|nr:alcohol dehydrogenase catalytic domain-containing protein [Variovorax sp. RKNM96]